MLISKELGLKFAHFCHQQQQRRQRELFMSCNIAISGYEEVLKSLNQFLNAFLPNIIGIDAWKEVIANKEEKKDEVSCYCFQIVLDLHLLLELAVLKIKAFPQDRQINKFEIDFFLLA